MPEPSKRTKSMKHQALRLPGGRSTIHHKRKKPDVPPCSQCGRRLTGVPHRMPSKLRKLLASQRRVERTYGGQLCHSCLRDHLKKTVRSAYTL